jgi:hypothetical protein
MLLERKTTLVVKKHPNDLREGDHSNIRITIQGEKIKAKMPDIREVQH